ncbi:hypothetical protein JCM10213v2_001386 [Rhodosporidiobolus nylandii]
MAADPSESAQNQHRRTSAPSTPSSTLHLPSSLLGAFTQSTPLNSPTLSRTESHSETSTPRPSAQQRRASSSLKPIPPPTSSDLPSATPHSPAQPLNLAKLAAGVVPSRSGSVLARNLILKSDYRYIADSSGDAAPSPASTSGLNLSGATNLRDGGLGVWGVAQPTVTGVRTILSVLRAKGTKRRDGKMEQGHEVAFFCTREEPVLYLGGQPYVLREASHPKRTYSISDRAENLEEVEARLKQDILRESARYGGLILVHSESPAGGLQANWISTDEVLTLRELFAHLQRESYNVTYYRCPVGRDQSPQSGYLDTYTSLLSRIPTSTTCLFNCGAGVVRSTFAMSVALLVRRKQMLKEGKKDPYPADEGGAGKELQVAGAERVLRAQSEQARRDKSLLRLMHVLAKCLPSRSQGTILALLSSQPGLLENLRSALLGNFDLILSLLSVIDDGSEVKRVVDAVVDNCDAMINLRESILTHRVRYASLALSDSTTASDQRSAALAALERYFFLIAFAAFSTEASSALEPGGDTFSGWLKKRGEVARMISRMRKTGGTAAGFYVFSPVHDLSAIAKGEAEGALVTAPGKAPQEGQVGDEWAEQIIRSRSGILLRPGMILKADQWLHLAEGQSETALRGAINFRRVPGSLLYGLSQPTEDGVRHVLESIKADLQPGAKVVWVGVREEPLIYANGTPYVLRNSAMSLRNVKSYSGISSTRLELLETRLKTDVQLEARTFEGRILVATEAEDGSVNPVWETVAGADGESEPDTHVNTLREVMDSVGGEVCGEKDNEFRFIRVPITAEASPDFHDLREIIETVTQLDVNNSAIIVNDQLGRGRATRTLVVIKILQDWIRNGGKLEAPPTERPSYTIINNLLRVVRNGFEVKNAVDAAITACGEPFDLLESIESARQAAEDSEGETREKWVARGVRELRGYFFLILFASFLNESKPSTWNELGRSSSYEAWVRARPVFRTIEKELDGAGIEDLVPLKRSTATEIGTGTASDDEVAEFVKNRSGRCLSAFMALKSDFFSGLQKLSLPERIEGAPNFRRVPLAASTSTSSTASAHNPPASEGQLVYGSGMPRVDGLRRMLEKIEAKETRIVWSCMREEPICFIAGRPHVLRSLTNPLENVITTGVTTTIVEAQEDELKQDLLREREKTGGKVLLHDEIEDDGKFTITASWEEVAEEDILTPREVFELMQKEGFRVDYARLPVTDEQAPLPGVFTAIEQRVSSALTLPSDSSEEMRVSFGWNCQMGRGRTTTGMVACALVHRILFSPASGRNAGASADLAASFLLPVADEGQHHELHWDGREAEPYLDGEYKIVLQIVGVLAQGKMAKRLTDKAIDDCEAVQNLRTAVYSFKLRVVAAEEGTKKREKLFEQALNYLYRYATLIVFADYLLSKSAHLASLASSSSTASTVEEDEREYPPFEQYLRERTEIRKILSRRTLE